MAVHVQMMMMPTMQDGPTHAYIGASPGCWAVFGEVLAMEYGEYGYPHVHRLTVDAYAVQHPGVPSRWSIQSVAVHLTGLYLVLDQGMDYRWATRAMARAVDSVGQSLWLEPPASPGKVTILDAHKARDLAEHTAAVELWARSVWEAWDDHHDSVRKWAVVAAGDR
jgi:hypothetical protein